MNRRILIVFSLALVAVAVRAVDTNQVKALTIVASVFNAGDTLPTGSAATNKPVWESSLSFGLTLTRGNSDNTLANGTFGTHRNNLTNEWVFGADATYGENNSVADNETLHGFGQYNHLFSARWFGYARADGLHDGISDVKYRVTLSPGVGYYFIKTNLTKLVGEIGPAVVFERLDGEYNMYMTPRFAERFEHKFKDHARVWEKTEFLPQVDRWGNNLINAEVGMEATVTKQLNLRTVVQDNYANEPAPGHKDNDVKLISGLVYKF